MPEAPLINIFEQRRQLEARGHEALDVIVDYAETTPLIEETEPSTIIMSTVIHTIEGLIITYPVYSVGLFYGFESSLILSNISEFGFTSLGDYCFPQLPATHNIVPSREMIANGGIFNHSNDVPIVERTFFFKLIGKEGLSPKNFAYNVCKCKLDNYVTNGDHLWAMKVLYNELSNLGLIDPGNPRLTDTLTDFGKKELYGYDAKAHLLKGDTYYSTILKTYQNSGLHRVFTRFTGIPAKEPGSMQRSPLPHPVTDFFFNFGSHDLPMWQDLIGKRTYPLYYATGILKHVDIPHLIESFCIDAYITNGDNICITGEVTEAEFLYHHFHQLHLTKTFDYSKKYIFHTFGIDTTTGTMHTIPSNKIQPGYFEGRESINLRILGTMPCYITN